MIFPGRAEGSVVRRGGSKPQSVPRAAVLVIDQPTPELTPLLHNATAVLSRGGSPVGHLATLLREFSIPSIFQLGGSLSRLRNSSVVSVDATNRKIYEESRWPGVRELVLTRIAAARRATPDLPYELILSLNLTDPTSSAFKARSCASIHDVIRFVHEMSVRAMFRFGDQHNRRWRAKTCRLKTELPLRVKLLALDRPRPEKRTQLRPEQVESVPFKAFWRGVADPALAWRDRWSREFAGLPSSFREEVLGGHRGPRRKGEDNFLIFASDYLNFNARFDYHYAMIDSLIGPGDQKNYVHFRFYTGGADPVRRKRRALFLELVLRELRFGVDRRGDLVTAWMRRYSQRDSLEALEMLGRLMVCSRQLDLLMNHEQDVQDFYKSFISGDYRAFDR